MLLQKQRLPRAEFNLGKHLTVKNPYFTVKFRHNGLEYSRIGIVISATSVKNSTSRNFLRRQVRAIFENIRGDSRDFVLIFHNPSQNLNRKNLQNELKKVFK